MAPAQLPQVGGVGAFEAGARVTPSGKKAGWGEASSEEQRSGWEGGVQVKEGIPAQQRQGGGVSGLPCLSGPCDLCSKRAGVGRSWEQEQRGRGQVGNHPQVRRHRTPCPPSTLSLQPTTFLAHT